MYEVKERYDTRGEIFMRRGRAPDQADAHVGVALNQAGQNLRGGEGGGEWGWGGAGVAGQAKRCTFEVILMPTDGLLKKWDACVKGGDSGLRFQSNLRPPPASPLSSLQPGSRLRL